MKSIFKILLVLSTLMCLCSFAPVGAAADSSDEPVSTVSLVSSTPSSSTVASGTCGANLTWTLDDLGTLTSYLSSRYNQKTAPNL